MRDMVCVGLWEAAGQRPSCGLKAIKGIEVMYKVMLATLLATSLLAPPLPYFSVAFAQQPAAAEKNAKTKKEPSAGQVAARERQKKCAAEWKEAKATGKTAKEETWPKFWSDCNKRLKAAAK
jgi:hypothetical protein